VKKGSAFVDAVVWDRAGSQALSYKRCVSVLRTTYIYKTFPLLLRLGIFYPIFRNFCKFYR